MGLYERHILPRLINCACSVRPVMRQREKIVPLAEGNVLEIGVGSGLNLPYYNKAKVTRLWGLEPSEAMLKRAAIAAQASGIEVEFIGLPGDEIPLDDRTIDTVVITYTLCTIPETEPALRQMARVLKPGGRLLFCEHGAAPDANVQKWQNRLDPLWGLFSGGCHINREIPQHLEQGGFTITNLETMYLPGLRFASFNYWGTATCA